MSSTKKQMYKKITLALSLCLLLMWTTLRTGSTHAWFTDSTPEIKNIFHFAEFDLEVSYKQDDGSYKEIDQQSKVLKDNALYEPGYVQVVYLRVRNKGNVPFNFKTAVIVTDYTIATNVFGVPFNLQDYLRFGIVQASTEASLDEKLESRALAVESAQIPLKNYTTDKTELGAGEEMYLGLIVQMPTEVGNDANYRGDVIPRVELGLIFQATQTDAPEEGA